MVPSIQSAPPLRPIRIASWRRVAPLVVFTWAISLRASEFPDERLPAVTFRHDVMAVLSKAGCNAGACHGNKNGKGGLKLSLRGEDPARDWVALSREFFGRRANPSDPDASLILLKPTTQLPHEGGLRFGKDSVEYDILRRWIAAGMEADDGSVPDLKAIEVEPGDQILEAPAGEFQLKVQAHFSDGSTRDVTRLAVYDSVQNCAKISPAGKVEKVADGETTILVRYLGEQVPVRVAFINPLPGFQWRGPAERNYIDASIFEKLRRLKMNPSEVCADTVFIRRAYLDLIGLLPTRQETERFLGDARTGKRAALIDELLERPEFADFWALKWSDLLRNEEKVLDRKGVQSFHHWIRESIASHTGLDRFVHELLSARGSTYENPPANYYRANRNATARSEATAQLFLGTRLQCAQCHNHPFDRWTQDDYYSWASVFGRVNYKVLENRRRDNIDSHEFIGEQIVYLANEGQVNDPRTGRPVRPRLLGTGPAELPAESDPLTALADWIIAQPLFARAQVNRIWYHLLGRGLVDPIDDFRATNPASHPGLLEELAGDFAAHGFDLRYAVRLIASSATYQLSSSPNESNRDDASNFSHGLVRRLSAEQLVDCQDEVLATPSRFNGYPAGLRASQLPGVEAVRARDQKPSGSDQFLSLFGKPARLLTCECERSNEVTMNQAFQLISGPGLNELLTRADNRLSRLLQEALPPGQMIEELYWAALSRPPSLAEKVPALAALEKSREPRAALEDLAWALLNAKEFVLRQ